jgi:hypothetical protein
MSTFGGKADITGDNPMSAFDPKRTLWGVRLTDIRNVV